MPLKVFEILNRLRFVYIYTFLVTPQQFTNRKYCNLSWVFNDGGGHVNWLMGMHLLTGLPVIYPIVGTSCIQDTCIELLESITCNLSALSET